MRPGDPWDHLGTPPPDGFPAPSGLGPDYGTTHLTVTDADENAVSLTQTLHGYSGIVTPGVGAMMNNGMGWFYPGPGTLNSVRRYGSGLHNMVPVILTREGMLRAALGSSGGRRIWTAVLQTIINLVDFAMPIQDAIQAPRIHVETDEVLIDGRYPLNVRTELTRMGHSLITTTPRHNLVPFSEPNGILRGDSGFESGVYPVSKPTTAIGYEDGDEVIDPESPMDDHPDLANDLMP